MWAGVNLCENPIDSQMQGHISNEDKINGGWHITPTRRRHMKNHLVVVFGLMLISPLGGVFRKAAENGL
jgi:hypothetical protein